MERPQRVEIVIGVRTVLMLLAFGVLVVLAVVSLGTLLSVFVAAVIALGLDPPVGALVRRGWGRGRAALAVFTALFAAVFTLVLVTAGPLWDQIVEFINELPAFWDELTQKPVFQDLTSTANADEKIRNALKELAAGLPDAASALLGIAAVRSARSSRS
jgi:predicted PurR-regulated permease PerM